MDFENYLDGSSDSDTDYDEGPMGDGDISDEDETYQNERLLKMINPTNSGSHKPDAISDFEQEMEAELDRRAHEVETEGGVEHQKSLSRSSSTSSLKDVGKPKPGPSHSISPKTSTGKKAVRFENPEKPTSSSKKVEDTKKFYDDVYFDSDDSDNDEEKTKTSEQAAKNSSKHPIISNDDLFYDPDSDKRDQDWVDKQRRKTYGTERMKPPPGLENTTANSQQGSSRDGQKSESVRPLPKSDAVLNCPACFSLLCLDCQRHDLYTNQYRAMFVSNCVIDRGEVLRVPCKSKAKGRKRKTQNSHDDLNDTSRDIFNPVKCKVCNTQVAMYDKDEIYHFFHIIASHA